MCARFRRAALLIGLLLSTWVLPTGALGAPTPREQSQALLAEGDAAYAEGRFDEAIRKYEASVEALTPDDRSGYVGSLLLRKTMRAYERRLAREADPASRRRLLESQHALVDAFLTVVEATPGAVQDVGDDVIAELSRTRDDVEAALAGLPNPDAEEPEPAPEPDPKPEPEAEPGPAADPKPTLDRLGLGLVIGGGAIVATGIGIAIGHGTIRSSARALADTSPDFAVGTEARTAYLEGEDRRARRFLIAGSVIGAVGLATAIGGTIRLVLHRRKKTHRAAAWHLTPARGRSYAGILVHRRF